MHSTIVRGQNVFGFFTTVCFIVAALIAASDLLAPRTPKATVSVKDLQV
jgi:signal peptidase complex subunit 3